MKEFVSRRWFSLGLVLFSAAAYLAAALWLPVPGPRLILINDGRGSISNIQVSYTGGAHLIAALAPYEKWEGYLRASGESDVRIRWRDADGREHYQNAGSYFEAGYGGSLTVRIHEDALTTTDNITLPPIFNWCLNLFC